MKIYVNEQYEICALGSTDRADLIEIEADSEILSNWCDVALTGFKYEPSWACDENGEFILDNKGNRIQAGYAFYPFIDYNMLLLIQKQHEQSQQEITTLQLVLAESYEENVVLQDEITNTQLALAEIYEGMEV